MNHTKNLIWILAIFLLVSLVYAFPYSDHNGFYRTGNETQNVTNTQMAYNWTNSSNQISTSQGHFSMMPGLNTYGPSYVHRLADPAEGTACVEGKVRWVNGSDFCQIAGWIDDNITDVKSSFTIRYRSATPLMELREESFAPATDTLEGFNFGGAWNSIKMCAGANSWLNVSLNGTQVAALQSDTNQRFFSFTRWNGALTCGFEWANLSFYNGSRYNDSGGAAPAGPNPSNPNATLTAIDLYDGVALNNFSVTIFNESGFSLNYSTGNGTILVNNVSSFGFYNITFRSNQSGGYFNNTHSRVNITTGNTFQGNLFQSILYINASEIMTNNSILSFIAGAAFQTNQSNSSGFATLLLKSGRYNISGNATGYLINWVEVGLNALEKRYANVTLGKSNLSVRAIVVTNSSSVGVFTIVLRNTDGYDYVVNKSTTNGLVVFPTINGNYNLTFLSTGFATSVASITIQTTDIYPNYTFSVYITNSVNFSVYDEYLGKPNKINANVSFEFVSTAYSTNFTSSMGNYTLSLINPGDYRVTFFAPGYRKRDYYFTLSNNSHYDIDLYLLSSLNGTLVQFNVKDQSGTILQDSLIKLLRYYVTTNSYTTVAMAKTDFTGSALIDLEFNSAFYQTITTRNNTLVTSAGQRIYTTPINIFLQLVTSPIDTIKGINNVISSLSFNNVTQTFSFTYNDPLGTNRNGQLIVTKLTPDATISVCDNSIISASSTILCTVNITNLTGTFTANAYIDNAIQLSQTVSKTIATDFKRLAGKSGVLLSIIVGGTLAGLGAIVNPAIAIILYLVGLGGMLWLGFNLLNITIYISFVIVGGILIWKMRT